MATAPGVVYLQQQQPQQNPPGTQVPVPPVDPQQGGIPFDTGHGPLPHVPPPAYSAVGGAASSSIGFQEQQQPQQQFAPIQWQQHQQPQQQMLATTTQSLQQQQQQQQHTFTANGVTYMANGGVPLQPQAQQQQVPMQMNPGGMGMNAAAAGGGAGYVQQLPAQGLVVGTQGMGQAQFVDGQQPQQQTMMTQQPPLAQQPHQQQQQQMALQQAPLAQQQQQQQQLVMPGNGSLVQVVRPGQLPAGARIVSPDQLPPGAVRQFSPPLTRAATVPTTSPPPMFEANLTSPLSAKDPAASVLGFPPHSPYTQPATPATRSMGSPPIASSPTTSRQQPTPATTMQPPQTTATSPQSLMMMPAAMSPTVAAPQQIQGLALQQQQQLPVAAAAAQPQLLTNPVAQYPERQQAVWVQQGQQMVLMQVPTVTGGGSGQVPLPTAQPAQQAAMPPTFTVDANGNLVLLAAPAAAAATAAAVDPTATTTSQQEKQQFWTKERAEKSKATAKKALKQTKNALVKTNDFLGKAVTPIMPLLAVTDPELAAAWRAKQRVESAYKASQSGADKAAVGVAAVLGAAALMGGGGGGDDGGGGGFGGVDFGGMDFSSMGFGGMDFGSMDFSSMGFGGMDFGSMDFSSMGFGGMDFSSMDFGGGDFGGGGFGDAGQFDLSGLLALGGGGDDNGSALAALGLGLDGSGGLDVGGGLDGGGGLGDLGGLGVTGGDGGGGGPLDNMGPLLSALQPGAGQQQQQQQAMQSLLQALRKQAAELQRLRLRLLLQKQQQQQLQQQLQQLQQQQQQQQLQQPQPSLGPAQQAQPAPAPAPAQTPAPAPSQAVPPKPTAPAATPSSASAPSATTTWTARALPTYGLASVLLPPGRLSETDHHILSVSLPSLGPSATLELDLLHTPRQRRDRLSKLARLLPGGASADATNFPVLLAPSLRPDVAPDGSPGSESIALAVGLPAEGDSEPAKPMATYKLFVSSPTRTSSILISAFVPRQQLPVGRAAVESAAKSLRWLSSSPAPTTNGNSNSIGTRRDKTAELAGTRWQHFDSYTSPGAYSAGSFRETRDLAFSADCGFAYDRVFVASVSTFDSGGNATSDLTSVQQHDPDHTRGEYRLFACRGVNDADGDGDGAEQLVLAEDGSLDVKVWGVQRLGPGMMMIAGKKYLKQS